jgi:hypothetical protein
MILFSFEQEGENEQAEYSSCCGGHFSLPDTGVGGSFMRRMALAVGLIVLTFSVSTWARAQALAPNPELKKFDAFLGHWTSEGEYIAGSMGSGGKVTGERIVQRILGGFFIEFQSTIKGPAGESRSIWIVGYDPLSKKFFSNEYYDNGGTASGAYDFDGNTCIYSGTFAVAGKPYMLRMTAVLAVDLMSYAVKGEISADGKTWARFYEGKVVKSMPAPKR